MGTVFTVFHIHQFVGVEPHFSHLWVLFAEFHIALAEVLNKWRVTILLEWQRTVVDGMKLNASVWGLSQCHADSLNGAELVIVNDVLRIICWRGVENVSILNCILGNSLIDIICGVQPSTPTTLIPS